MEQLNLFGSLKFQDKININKKTFYRGNESRGINTQENFWEYEFYIIWDKRKNLLPPISHIVKIYVSFKKKIKNGKEIFEVDKYIKGVLRDLQNNSEEEITSVSK